MANYELELVSVSMVELLHPSLAPFINLVIFQS